jgi:hypothetical protein
MDEQTHLDQIGGRRDPDATASRSRSDVSAIQSDFMRAVLVWCPVANLKRERPFGPEGQLTAIARRMRRGCSPSRQAGLPWLQPLLLRFFCAPLVRTAARLGAFSGRPGSAIVLLPPERCGPDWPPASSRSALAGVRSPSQALPAGREHPLGVCPRGVSGNKEASTLLQEPSSTLAA